jgi:Zn-dependent membrane protease YugP
MFYIDPIYFLFVALPLLVVTGLCQLWVKSAYAKYSKIGNAQGVSGAEAARAILHGAGVEGVRVEEVNGWLSDHYSPRERVLRLSPQNYSGVSIAAVGIAAHEAGHALQHALGYKPLVLRNLAVPMASIGSGLGYLVIVLGFVIGGGGHGGLNIVSLIGLCLIASVAVYQLINLPVEFDASRRALEVLPRSGILTPEETRGARAVLVAAAMTYVAATLAAVVEVLYWAWRLGLIGGNRRDSNSGYS